MTSPTHAHVGVAAAVATCLATLGIGCVAGETQPGVENGGKDCPAGTSYHAELDLCIANRSRDRDGVGDDERDSGPADVSRGDLADGGRRVDAGTPDVRRDGPSGPGRGDATADTSGPDAGCDSDGDGFSAVSCGGRDCRDDTPAAAPDLKERCDRYDNDCSGSVNEKLDCSFYAHEGDTLYRVDPFEKSSRQVGAKLTGLHDLDTHPDGTLYGVNPDGIYRFDSSSQTWKKLKSFFSKSGSGKTRASYAPEQPNGLAIQRSSAPLKGFCRRQNGRSAPLMFMTSKNYLYCATYRNKQSTTYDWVEKAPKPMGKPSGSAGSYQSSGDCVINKRSLYVTSKHDDRADHLVTLKPATGRAIRSVPIVDRSSPSKTYTDVYGLTSAWGKLYGLTVQGHLLRINPRIDAKIGKKGNTTLVHTFPKRRWYGAASTARREANVGN